MSANTAIQDEVTSLNAIFDEGTLSPIEQDARVYSLRLPYLPSITLRIEFPADYPDAPPSILGTQSVGQDVPKGMGNRAVEEDGSSRGTADVSIDLGPEPPWVVAPALTEKKSVFLARVAPVSSPAQARQYVAHLLATDKKAARATHNMTAWRIKGPNDTSYQDCDDDGETAAGSRMLHLMQLMDVWNVMVIVTRWYGGILLGPDRFRIINTAAREALVLGGYTKEGKDGDEKKKGKK
ncbi:UPF0029 multi-domain protein [Pyrenophora tritici-repentis]|nr:Impact family protein [Pyrenophora tritici-repentis]PZD33560.1 UPF0029 multi-domain protein [Pyrenophora tritici-repentis]